MSRTTLVSGLVHAVLLTLLSASAWAQQADPLRPPPVLPLEAETAPKLIAYAPLEAPLARGVAIIQHRTEQARLLALFGKEAAAVSPRVAHIHVTVDDLPLQWAHTSSDPIILVGLKPGKHTVLLELADPTHKIATSTSVTFVMPDLKAAKAHGHHQ
jgi:hypothetical protein